MFQRLHVYHEHCTVSVYMVRRCVCCWGVTRGWTFLRCHKHMCAVSKVAVGTSTHTHTYLPTYGARTTYYVGPKLQQHTHSSLCSHYQTVGYAYQYGGTEVTETNTVGPLIPLDPAVGTWFRGVCNSEVCRFIHISA